MTPSPVPPDPDEKARLILGAPLGREFISEFLGRRFVSTLFDAVGLGEVLGSSIATSAEMRPRWRRPKPKVSRPMSDWTGVSVSQVQEAVAMAVAAAQWRTLTAMDELELLSALAETTCSFGFGQGDEALWGLMALAVEELLPLARALVVSPATVRWWEPVHRADQRFLAWDGMPVPTGQEVERQVRDSMADERLENEEGQKKPRPRAHADTRIGATWWSAPDFAPSTWTTPPFGAVPTISLRHFIDTFAPHHETEATVWSLELSPKARVLEIFRPGDWRELVERYPRDVTGTHDGEWRAWSGVPGPWRLPDWELVMDDYDGVHVTIGGYVSTCGLALPVGDAFTMLSGWIPDSTLWLRDVSPDKRELGTWKGHPHGVNGWDDVLSHWTPQEDT